MAFRILSLDGGGSWSLIQILTLIDLYRSGGALLTGHHVLADFDLVVASSGGSLVLGGLVKDLPLTEIRAYFEDETLRRVLFTPSNRSRGPFARLSRRIAGIGPRYAAQKKLEGLREVLNSDDGEPGIGDVTVDGLKTRLRLPTQFVITAFDYDRRCAVLFRSNPRSAAASFATPALATLAEAIHAATNAPIAYFDAPAAVSRGRRCWDGAVGGAGNPVLIGIAEALAAGIDPGEIQVLSIGSGSVVLPMATGSEDRTTAKLVQARAEPSRTGDLRQLAASLFDDPSDGESLLAHLALRQKLPQDADETVGIGNLIRMNPLVQPIRAGGGGWLRPAGLAEADGAADEFVRLRNLPMDTVEAADLALLRKFCALWHSDAVVNQPIRANSDTFACEIGHRWYSEAKAHWLALAQQQGGQSTAAGGYGGPFDDGNGFAPGEPRSASPSRFAGSRMS